MTAFAGKTHPGYKRSHNEDCYLTDPELGLFLVADGVGGHADGEVAAAIVRDTLHEDVGGGGSLVDSIRRSHRAVLDEIARRDESNMGSTVVAALVSGSEYDIAWVGDSRAYSYNGELKQITRDHNPVSEMLARGAITPEQASVHPERNVLSQSLGVSENIELAPGRIRGDLAPGQQLLLCSDGLTDEVPDSRIDRIMEEQPSPQAQVEALVEAALAAGGRDNITVVIVGDKDAGAAGEPRAREHSTLDHALAVTEPQEQETSHDRKALIVLGLLAAVAAAWVAMKIF